MFGKLILWGDLWKVLIAVSHANLSKVWERHANNCKTTACCSKGIATALRHVCFMPIRNRKDFPMWHKSHPFIVEWMRFLNGCLKPPGEWWIATLFALFRRIKYNCSFPVMCCTIARNSIEQLVAVAISWRQATPAAHCLLLPWMLLT